MTVVVLLLLREPEAGLTVQQCLTRNCPHRTQVSPAELLEQVFSVLLRVVRNHWVPPASPTVCTLSICSWPSVWLAAERLLSPGIGSAASRTHCPCVMHVNSLTPCCCVALTSSAQYSWQYGSFCVLSVPSCVLLQTVDLRQHSWLCGSIFPPLKK